MQQYNKPLFIYQQWEHYYKDMNSYNHTKWYSCKIAILNQEHTIWLDLAHLMSKKHKIPDTLNASSKKSNIFVF